MRRAAAAESESDPEAPAGFHRDADARPAAPHAANELVQGGGHVASYL